MYKYTKYYTIKDGLELIVLPKHIIFDLFGFLEYRICIKVNKFYFHLRR